MKRTIFLLFILVPLLNLGLFTVNANEVLTTYEYVNDNGITISKNLYKKLVDLGFEDDEISQLTLEEVRQLESINVIKTSKDTKYIKTSVMVDEFGNKVKKDEFITKEQMDNELAKELEKENSKKNANRSFKQSSPILLGDLYNGCTVNTNDVSCYGDTEYRRQTTTIVVVDIDHVFIKVTLEWLKMPEDRNDDIIGISLPAFTIITQDTPNPAKYGGKQTWTASSLNLGYVNRQSTSYKPGSGNFKINSHGVALSQDLPNNYYSNGERYDLISIKNSLWVEAYYFEYNRDVTSQAIQTIGSYSHNYEYISITGVSFGIDSSKAIGFSVDFEWTNYYEEPTTVMVTLNNASQTEFPYVNENEPYVTYYNRKGVWIDTNAYNNLIKLGYDELEIDNLDQTEFDKYKTYRVISSRSTFITSSDSSKKMTLTISKLSNGRVFIKANVDWLKLPYERYWDLLGIDIPSNSTIHEYSGKQLVKQTSNNDIWVIPLPMTETYSYSVNSSGVVLKHNMVDDGFFGPFVKSSMVTLQVEVSSNNLSDYEAQAFFAHQVSNYNISNTQYYMSSDGNGIAFTDWSLYNKYNSTQFQIKDFTLNATLSLHYVYNWYSNPLENAIDSDINTRGRLNGTGYVIFKTSSVHNSYIPKTISVIFDGWVYTDDYYLESTLKIYGSIDGVNWTLLCQTPTYYIYKANFVYNLSTSQEYKYFKLINDRPENDGTYIYDFKVFY